MREYDVSRLFSDYDTDLIAESEKRVHDLIMKAAPLCKDITSLQDTICFVPKLGKEKELNDIIKGGN